MWGRFIRIYHTQKSAAEYNSAKLSLAGLKVYSGGIDIAGREGVTSRVGADVMNSGGTIFYTPDALERNENNDRALTDGVVGSGAALASAKTNYFVESQPYAKGLYIELDLGAVYDIDSLALWGRADAPGESDDLRIYVSQNAFPGQKDTTKKYSSNDYFKLADDLSVRNIDVAKVETADNTLSLAGVSSKGIVADLSKGTVIKTLDGTRISVNASGRYIRIYHTLPSVGDYNSATLSLAELKVYSGGAEVAQGKKSTIGADRITAGSGYPFDTCENSNTALTDGRLNGLASAKADKNFNNSNLQATGLYIDLDLGYQYAIDSIALWGRADKAGESNNLRIYVSDSPFPPGMVTQDTPQGAGTTYFDIAANPSVTSLDVKEVASAQSIVTDTLSGIENLIGTAFDDSITGDDNDNTLTGGAGKDRIMAGPGADTVLQDMEAVSDTLDGEAGNDTLDYSKNRMAGGIQADLKAGTVTKVLAGTSTNVGAMGRYIRIYHNDAVSALTPLSLTGLKVYSGGIDVAAGRASLSSVDGGSGAYTDKYRQNNPAALTDGELGGTLKLNALGQSNIASSNNYSAGKNYIELDLGDNYAVDSISLWGNASSPEESNNLRVYVSSEPFRGAQNNNLAYDDLANKKGVATVDLKTLTVKSTEAATDTAQGFENIVGTDFADSLTGDDNDNILTGGGGADTVRGAGGNDKIELLMERVSQTVDGGDGSDLLDYSIPANMQPAYGISANLANPLQQTVTKTFYGTSASTAGVAGKYIRIYHTGAVSATQALSLTGLKVFATGANGQEDVARGITSSSGADSGAASGVNSTAALTDGALGGAYALTNGQSNLAWSGGTKPYIELELTESRMIDFISLWGRGQLTAESNDLRVFVSDVKFSDLYTDPQNAYAQLTANTAVSRFDVKTVDTSPFSTYTDTLSAIEGVSLDSKTVSKITTHYRRLSAQSLVSGVADNTVTGGDAVNGMFGDEGSDNFAGGGGDDVLVGAGGNDKLDGGPGDDNLNAGRGFDTVIGGDGDDLILEGMEAASDLVDGGAGNDTVDYSIFRLAGIASTGIVADLDVDGNGSGRGLVRKVFDGTSIDVGVTGYRYLRIYHSDANATLALTELKVFSNGVNVAPRGTVTYGSDPISAGSYLGGDPRVLTDGKGGGQEWQAATTVISTKAGIKAYIDVDLGGYYGIDSISLWGSAYYPGSNDNLRVYVSQTQPPVSSPTAYADLAADADVVQVDLRTVATSATTTIFDTLMGVENMVGTELADTITGDANDNTLSGNGGDDVLSGKGGNDELHGDEGDDTLDGGMGDDMLTGNAGKDSVKGGDGNDVILQDIEAYAAGSSGAWDTLDGGDGADTVNYSSTVFPASGRAGTVAGEVTAGGIDANLLTGQAIKFRGAGFSVYDILIGIESVTGTNLNDTLTGDDNANALDGRGGDDVLIGNGGDDILIGGYGNDKISGGDGNDDLAGEAGVDSVSGGDGDDEIEQSIEVASDTLDGGAGRDTADYSGTDLRGLATTGIVARLDADGKGLGNGTVVKTLDGTFAAVGVLGRYIRIYHNDAVTTQNLALTGLKVFAGGVDVAKGKVAGYGSDTGSFNLGPFNNPQALTDTDLGGGAYRRPDGKGNVVHVGTTLNGNSAYVELDLGPGPDGAARFLDSIALWGVEGVSGFSDNLRVYISETPFKVDFPTLGTSFNPSYKDLDANVNVTRVDVGTVATTPTSFYTDTLIGIENVVGTALADSLTGDGNSNELSGRAGNDTLDGAAGDDRLNGGVGADKVSGGAGDDIIEQIVENAGDALDGGAGTDTADYSADLTGITTKGITADLGLADKQVAKVTEGTAVGVGMQGRYIRIYHNDVLPANASLSLTGLKVFAGGKDVAAGLPAETGADSGVVSTFAHDRLALTDQELGVAWNNNQRDNKPGPSNLAWSALQNGVGSKTYIQLDLGSASASDPTALWDIDSIALWGRLGGESESNNLRVYVSNTAFDANTTYASLAARAADPKDGSVNLVDLDTVVATATTTVYDTLKNIENLVGTALDDSLTGDGNANALSGGGGKDTLAGAGGDDTLVGDLGDDSLDGGAGNDVLAGGMGSDTVKGGDGDDRILQNMERGVSDLLDGGAGNDTVDYSVTDLTGMASQGITADLNLNAQGVQLVTRYFAGTVTSAGTPVWGQYIRIYHNDAVAANAILSLTGLKVFAGGVDVAAKQEAVVGADSGTVQNYAHNKSALTDADVGGIYQVVSGKTNLAWVQGNKGYIELKLDSPQAIDTLALWGRANGAGESNDLRIYVSATAFGASATYDSLKADPAVAMMEVQAVDVTANVSMVDSLKNVENLIGTALADSLKGDGNKNALFGKEGDDILQGMGGDDFLAGDIGNDTVDGGAGNDVLSGGAGKDSVKGGDGDDIIVQDMDHVSGDTLDGGAGTDLVDYSASDADMAGGINANLATGKVDKLMGGTALSIASRGRYIRIYHYDDTTKLSLAGLKVYVGGVDVAAGKALASGADIDTGSGAKKYLQLDLGGVRDIDSLVLQANSANSAESSNLRIYVSEFPLVSVGGENLGYDDVDFATGSVGRIEVGAVDVATATAFGDVLISIENLIGTAMNDTLTGSDVANDLRGGAGNDVLDGGKGNDTLAGGAGQDTVKGGDGDDVIRQDLERVSDTLDGGAGNDTADYSLSGMAGGINADLAGGTVIKNLAGTSVGMGGTTGQFIRIYHTDALAPISFLSLTGLKVYVGGADVAAGKESRAGADDADSADRTYFNRKALTDSVVGAAWNNQTSDASNLAWVNGAKAYIELDLGSPQAIDSIALWGRLGGERESGNLRVYVSTTAFDATTSYLSLAADPAVAQVDVAAADAASVNTRFTDALISIENLIGTAMADTLAGDANANRLSGGAGNDTLNGGKGNDTLDGGAGADIYIYSKGDGADTIQDFESTTGTAAVPVDTLILVGLAMSDTQLSRIDDTGIASSAGKHLKLTWTGNGTDSVTLKNYFSGNAADLIEKIVFSDNTEWGNADVLAVMGTTDSWTGTPNADIKAVSNGRASRLSGLAGNDTLTGSALNDVLDGGDGDDTLSGLGGNDFLYGGAGNDSYQFNLGGGQDTIIDISGADRIVFGAGITADKVTASLANGQVKLSLATGESIGFAAPSLGSYAIEQFVFTDGTKDVAWLNTKANLAPTGADKPITLNEDGSYAITAADLGFGDPNAGDSLSAVRIDSLPVAGGLKLNGINITATQQVSAADLAAGRLVFSPAANANGNNYASFSFSVKDQYGAFDASPNKLSFNVTPVNEAPTLSNFKAPVVTVNEDSLATITVADLQAKGDEVDSDGPAGAAINFVIKAVNNGTLWIGASPATATPWDVVSNNMVDATHNAYWLPAANAKGTFNAFTAVAKDSGGTESANAIQAQVMVTAVNDAPTGTVSLRKDGEVVISTTVKQGDILTVDTSDLKDADGPDVLSLRYQWQSSADGIAWSAISGAMANSFTLTQAQAGQVVRAAVSYTDGVGNVENVNSAATLAVNRFIGTAGNDTLAGSAGPDRLEGLAGDDLYTVNNAGDVVVEGVNAGTDTVQASVTYTLTANVEKLTLTGAATINGTGNELDNTLVGNSAANAMKGSGGNDTLDGGAGTDTADYSGLAASGGIVASLASGKVNKIVASGAVSVNMTGQYIRIYHTDASKFLNLTGLKVYDTNGKDIAFGTSSKAGADGSPEATGISQYHNLKALTDGSVGGAWNERATADTSNIAWAGGVKPYFELNLGSSYNISALALWGRMDSLDGSNKLRVYVSNTPFGTSSYDRLEGSTDVARVDVGSTTDTVNATDILVGIENLVGTAFDDSLMGEAGNNSLVGAAGNDSLYGSAGNDTLDGGAGTDTADYSGLAAGGGIVANLASGMVTKVVATGARVDVSMTGKGQYIRIYHTDASEFLNLTGLKVYDTNGEDIAFGKGIKAWADSLPAKYKDGITKFHNPNALTDGSVGGAWNEQATAGTSNIAWAGGVKPYFELDLGSSYNISALALWGRMDFLDGSNKLRVFVSNTPFGTSSYDQLQANASVARVDVGSTTDTVTVTDTLVGIENLVGTAFGDSLTGDAGNNSLVGAAGNDSLYGSAGNDTLDGGAGTDTADYSGLAAGGGIVASLDSGMVTKIVATGARVDVSMTGKGQYIRIYHTDAKNILNLTGLKVYDVNGVDIAFNRPSDAGADSNPETAAINQFHNRLALTDGSMGGKWNEQATASTSNIAWTAGTKPYFELDLGGSYDISALALWGRMGYPGESNNLRVYISNTAFGTLGYDQLQANASVARVDVGSTTDTVTTTDTLVGMENLVGTLFGDSLTGDANANVLSGGAGNDVLDGGIGNDTLTGGAGADTVKGGEGDDLILQDNARLSDTLDGGAGSDTVDYSATNDGVDADLGRGTAILAGTTVSMNRTLRQYIRIYHTDSYVGGELGLTGMKVYAGGRDVAFGLPSSVGTDGNAKDMITVNNSKTALTDAAVGGGWNSLPGDQGNVAYANTVAGGAKGYIELKLDSPQPIDSISLWGDANNLGDSKNLRVYVSNAPFNPLTTYASLAADTTVARFDLAEVDINATAALTFTDSLSNIENVTGTAMNDRLAGDAGNNSLVGGAGNDSLYGSAGNDTLDGGAGTDTADYSGLAAGWGIVASLDSGMVTKIVATGARVAVNMTGKGRYIRIYHTDASNNILNLTGLKVYDANGKDIASGKSSTAGADSSPATVSINQYHNPWALTDESMGGKWNEQATPSTSNIAWTAGTKPYFELDLGGSYDISALALWGRLEFPGESNKLCVFVSNTPFGTSSYDQLQANASVAHVDVVSTTDTVTAIDTLVGIENLVGTVFDDSLTGDGNANTLSGGGGNDKLDGAAGSDNMYGGAGDDNYAVDNAGDVVVENFNEGMDTVFSLVSYALTPNVENLTLTGTAPINGTGNELNNAMVGNNAANTMTGGAGNDTLNGNDGNDTLDGQAGNDTLDGGAGNDILAGGVGSDLVRGGDGDDLIRQDSERVSDTLDGGAGNDTVDYSIGIAGGINASLATGRVVKNLAGTSVSVGGMLGRYIRIYHNDTVPLNTYLSLTGLKVYSGGVDVAAGKVVVVGADGGGASLYANNPLALTDGAMGEAWNGKTGSLSNLAWVSGTKGYIELDLGKNQAIDSIALWARGEGPGESSNLRIYVGKDPFGSSPTAYTSMNGNTSLWKTDVGTADMTTTTDTLISIENLIGTAMDDTLTGDGNANVLRGGGGNNTLDGGAGSDTVDYSATNDGVDADLGRGTAILAGTTVSMNRTLGQYIRIYHTDSYVGGELGLTGMKVYAGGRDVAFGLPSSVGTDGNAKDMITVNNSKTALTDAAVGGGWNSLPGDQGNVAYANTVTGGAKGYIELKLDSPQPIDSISLWGDANNLGDSKNLRVYVSNAPFNPLTTYASLAADTTVARFDLAEIVISAGMTTWTDTLVNIENLVGSAMNDTLKGDAYANVLSGGAGKDVLDGGAGNDTLAGGAGSDTYKFLRGGGADTIQENDATPGNTDVLQFGADINASQLWLRHGLNTNDLEVSVIGSGDKVTVSNWYLASAYHVEQIKSGEGKTLLDTDVDKLVQAMASFAAPPATITLTDSYKTPVLMNALAANWH
jgi:Ca2+-binding RTX toxin-like protein